MRKFKIVKEMAKFITAIPNNEMVTGEDVSSVTLTFIYNGVKFKAVYNFKRISKICSIKPLNEDCDDETVTGLHELLAQHVGEANGGLKTTKWRFYTDIHAKEKVIFFFIS